MKTLAAGAVIGIIGGGQLARMMAMAAARLGFKTIVLSPEENCPAAQTANRHIIADYADHEALDALAAACDVITYEFENIPATAMDYLAQQAVVHPSPAALEIAQDRFNEKQFLHETGIATAPWRPVHDRETLIAALAACGGSGILKTRRFGYDGKGQVRLQSIDEETANAALAAINHAPAIMEGVVDFAFEISVIAARDMTGHVAFFDIPQNSHEDGILRRSIVPAALDTATVQAAQAAVQAIAHALNYTGVMAVEFFVGKDGALYANEIAPRVHNSGHWTEAACVISQFEQHIRAISGLPLGNPQRHHDCEMENLIGHDVEKLPALLAEPDIFVHLYGKNQVREGRKMGHITRLKR
ncbi:MAG: Phosphoribosylaminoimidazole carboxylase ATPase subunit [Candidatus Tokpelaia hoelldobleri]|uniref:N5-carboxyaminoimidazole ribonucleotide synthase n=1 Tax=Candidatus Tokpelaia hoelldobleri TaxID=1902579 RepID=A0A1U9JWR3_9HYPH|nr:MAG: Phosphoribosylaminoimidazole carboxylase ATPase subunit [Candidatus Tokpelaia hoelldoblerii]